jgi:hypothetical protein
LTTPHGGTMRRFIDWLDDAQGIPAGAAGHGRFLLLPFYCTCKKTKKPIDVKAPRIGKTSPGSPPEVEDLDKNEKETASCSNAS